VLVAPAWNPLTCGIDEEQSREHFRLQASILWNILRAKSASVYFSSIKYNDYYGSLILINAYRTLASYVV
jgi:hypothetical protein